MGEYYIRHISSAKKYKASDNTITTIMVTYTDGKTSFVPLDTNNSDYAALLEWAAVDGNNIADAD